MLEFAFMGLVLVVVIFVYIYKQKQFPVNCIVYENRANSIVPFRTKAGRIRDKSGKYFYRVKYPKFPLGQVKKTKAFDFESLLIDNKGKNLLQLYSPTPDIFVPLDMVAEIKEKIEIEVPKLDKDGKPVMKDGKPVMVKKKLPKIKVRGLDEDVRRMVVDVAVDGATRYHKKTKIEQYMPLILMIMFAVSIAIIIYSASDMLLTGSGIMANAAETAASVKGSILGQQIAIPK